MLVNKQLNSYAREFGPSLFATHSEAILYLSLIAFPILTSPIRLLLLPLFKEESFFWG